MPIAMLPPPIDVWWTPAGTLAWDSNQRPDVVIIIHSAKAWTQATADVSAAQHGNFLVGDGLPNTAGFWFQARAERQVNFTVPHDP